jgi:hypothetical protein
MSTVATSLDPPQHEADRHALHAKLSRGTGRVGMGVFAVALTVGLGYAASHLISDLAQVHPTRA